MRRSSYSPMWSKSHFFLRLIICVMVLAGAFRYADATEVEQGFEVTSDGIGPWKVGANAKFAPKLVEGISLQLDGDLICAVSTKRSIDRTRDGLGVGSSFAQMEKTYGVAELEAATGRLIFQGKAEFFDVTVWPMPSAGNEKPQPTALIKVFTVNRCEEGGE